MSDSAARRDDLGDALLPGDRESLAALFFKYRKRFLRMVEFRMDRRLAGRIDPDDVLQEAYLAASARLEHYNSKEDRSPFVWLRMIVIQTLTDLHRHHLGVKMRNVERELSLPSRSYPQTTSTSLAVQCAGRFATPSEAAAQAETVSQIAQAIAAMDPLDQEILALRQFEELSNAETAEVLGIQPSAAGMRFFRAIRRLRETLTALPGINGFFDV
jgi:RNA polymerase sigma-70 factor (ECF subfamily)